MLKEKSNERLKEICSILEENYEDILYNDEYFQYVKEKLYKNHNNDISIEKYNKIIQEEREDAFFKGYNEGRGF